MSLLPTLQFAPAAKVMQRFRRSVCTGELGLKLSCSCMRLSSPHLLNLGRSTAIVNCSAHLVQVSSSFAVIQRMATFSVIHPRTSEMFSTIPSTTNLFARSDDVAPSQWSLKRLLIPFSVRPTWSILLVRRSENT